jgi:hypothetical protein
MNQNPRRRGFDPAGVLGTGDAMVIGQGSSGEQYRHDHCVHPTKQLLANIFLPSVLTPIGA